MSPARASGFLNVHPSPYHRLKRSRPSRQIRCEQRIEIERYGYVHLLAQFRFHLARHRSDGSVEKLSPIPHVVRCRPISPAIPQEHRTLPARRGRHGISAYQSSPVDWLRSSVLTSHPSEHCRDLHQLRFAPSSGTFPPTPVVGKRKR